MGQFLTVLTSILAKSFPGSLFLSPPPPPDGKYSKEQTEKSTTILYVFSKPFVEVSINLY